MTMETYDSRPSDRTPTGWRSWDQIADLVVSMQNERGPIMRQMRDILDRYDGDWVIPVPSVATEPVLPPLTPALIGQAIDTKAMRASSVSPTLFFPAIEGDKDTGKRSRQYANYRKAYVQAVYEQSRWPLGRRRFYRQLSAYETASLCVVPDFALGMPAIEVRDPLGTFAEPQAYEQLRDPEYVGFVTRHSGAYLRRKYPWVKAEMRQGGPITDQEQDQLWDVVEWYDHDQFLWGLVGPVRSTGDHIYESATQRPSMQLSPAFPNRLGMLPCVVPHNVSLGRVASRISTLIGNVDIQAKLMALDIIAQEKAIFPDMYAIGQQNMMPTVVNGAWRDGREGEMNLLTGVSEVGMLRSTPDQRTSQTIDRLERNFRVSANLNASLTGENTSNLRTGRAMDTLANASIDPVIQEMHEISESYMPRVNAAIMAMGRTVFGDKPMTVFLPSGRGAFDFKPREHLEVFDGPEKYPNRVKYAIPGADIVEATQVVGSMIGAELMSQQTGRTMHPLLSDAEEEGKLIDEERFERALKESIVQKITSGEMPPIVAVKVRDHMQKGKDIFAAVALVDEELRAMQATQAPPAPEGMMAAPEAMPGMAGGPQAAQMPMSEQADPRFEAPGDVSQFRQMLQVMGS